VSDLDSTAADEGQVLGPRLGRHGADHAREAVEPATVHRRRRRQPQRHAVQHDRDVRGQCAQGPQRAAAGADPVVGDHLDDVDAIQVGEDAGRQLRSPAEPHTVTPAH
jgi:hypothetical protein